MGQSMADDNIVRSYRSVDPARRASAPAPSRDIGGNDPLAELARLIGQSDPFAELERTNGRASEARPRVDASPSDWRQTAAALARESMMREPPAADPRFEEVDQAIAAAKSLRPAHADPYARLADHASHPSHDEAAFDQAAAPHGSYADGRYDDRPQAGDQFGVHEDDRLRDPHAAGTQHSGQESENYFFDGAAAPADDRFYDDPPRARAANGLITAIVLVGCGILGTAGAYGYRTYYSGIRVADAPIIPAEKSPNKMVPPPAGGVAQAGKSVERVGPSNEWVVPHQEEPVAIPDSNGARGVLPAPFTTSPGPGPSVQANAVAGEPKKVHTVAIRPDGGDPTARPVGGAGLPLQTAPSSPSPPVATTRAPANPPAPRPASPPARTSGGPLSLEPGQAGDPASSYQSPRVTSGAALAGAAPANGQRLASAAPSGSAASGGYVVQISSQRSEADAQASFRSLQSKFPRELGEREAIVRRADLGPKGVYYRAMVGPFGTAGDADQFCGDLKAAGGQCIVQKN
jgi:hypothetical protein